MKKLLYILPVLALVFLSCKEAVETTSEISESLRPDTKTKEPVTKLSQAFKDYWYSGEAEITSYQLEQARYGEIRNGKAVLVFVTEDFLPEVQVKADNYKESNIPILKLNATKTFNTGIYPYSIMQSTFFPVANNQHALKISASVQEWCGHVYTQLNNRDDFEITSHSYFQGEADQNFNLEKTWTENELWTKLRIDPNMLPVGEIDVIPSLEFIRLKHVELKAYKARATLEKDSYILTFSELNRILKITFNPNFPFEINGWEETTNSGFGKNAKTLTTKATKLKTLKTDYWNKKSNNDIILRDSLNLR